MSRYTLNLLFLLLLLFPQAMVATDRGGPGIYLPQQETVVYITKTGEKYHRDGFRSLAAGMNAI